VSDSGSIITPPCTTVFFNVFSEAAPFAAILIAHGTHVLWGTPESRKGRNSRPRPRAGEGFLGRGQRASPHQLGSLGSAVSSPMGFGEANRKYILDLLRAKKMRLVATLCRTHFNFLLSTGGPTEPLEDTTTLGSAEPRLKNTDVLTTTTVKRQTWCHVSHYSNEIRTTKTDSTSNSIAVNWTVLKVTFTLTEYRNKSPYNCIQFLTNCHIKNTAKNLPVDFCWLSCCQNTQHVMYC